MRQFIASLGFVLAVMSSASLANVIDVFEQVKSDPNALYAFLTKMPKGGELHYHLAGGAYPEHMLAISMADNYCLNPDTLTVTSPSNHCVGIHTAELSNQPELYNKIIKAWSLKDFIPGPESAHDHFFTSFYKFFALVANHQPALLAEVMQRAAMQHELYMEIMVMPDNAKSASFSVPLTTNNYSQLKQQLLANPAFVAEIDATIAKGDALLPAARQQLGCEQKIAPDACNLTVKFQYYILRNQPLENFFPQALHAFAVADRSKSIIGVNLVQAEDSIIALRDYRQQMQIFAFLHQAYPNVHIALHAGELAPEAVMPEDLSFHIQDAIQTGHAQRIGHGVDIAYEHNTDAITKQMADTQVAVEINLVSNQKILGVSGRAHPLRYYLAHQVPVVLSTDDEGILRTDLTRQYVAAVMEHGVDYPTLKQINRNALTFSFLPGNSIWQSGSSNQLVADCQELTSSTCQHYVDHHEKARLQRQLELELRVFEQKFD